MYWLNPVFLADFLADGMAYLWMNQYSAEYGALLYERIGTIRIKIDGVLREGWNLGERLREFPPEGPFETFQKGRQANFAEWRAKAFRTRKVANI